MMKLNENYMEWLTSQTNRSTRQTQFLYEILDGDFEKLKRLEENIKNTFYSACPADIETINEVLELKPKSNWFKLK